MRKRRERTLATFGGAADALPAGLRDAGNLAFEGEGHGFRRAASQVAALEAELAFYGQVLGFPTPGVAPVAVRSG